MTLNFFTFCVDISRHSKIELQKCLILLIKSIHIYNNSYKLICYSNFVLDNNLLKDYNIEIRKYYDNIEKPLYNDKWLNLSYNKINIYKDLYDELKEDFIWIDLDTIITSNISYINELANCFVENGGNCVNDNLLFNNNDEITIPRNRYIQGNFWKLNINLYNNLIKTFDELTKQRLVLRYDVQDLFSYYVYIVNKGELKNINIIGNNVKTNTINGLCVWSKAGNTHANIDGFNNLYYEDNILKSKFYENKEIHILSFTFYTLKQLWNNKKFIEMFNNHKLTIGVFGTCRIDNYNIEDFIKTKNNYPFIYESNNYKINIRPLGYTTTSSDIYQNLSLIKSNQYKNITDSFIYINVLLKHGGKGIITELNYKYLILEICSIKKIIHIESNLIFPFEIEGSYNREDFKIESETFDETIQNIIKIRDLLNCEIILLPPITQFYGSKVLGIHENTIPSKVLEYRNDIIKRLIEASKYDSIYFINWNTFIKERGIDVMVKDQFHFTDYGKQYISQKIYDFIRRKKIYYKNEEKLIYIPHNNDKRHRYYKMFPGRNNCEVLFRLLVKYFYDEKLLDKSKNIIDLGAWIGDNVIPWAMIINGIVYAIDPSPENINYINELSILNGLSNITTIEKCISDKIENIYANGDLKHTEFNTNGGKITLRATTIDNLYNEGIISNIGFIHLDVEGFEQKVLNGTIQIIEKERPIIVWENHLNTDNYKGTCKFFSKYNYKTYLINETFPHCRNDCRNFLSISNENNVIKCDKINTFFNDSKYDKYKADIKKRFIIKL